MELLVPRMRVEVRLEPPRRLDQRQGSRRFLRELPVEVGNGISRDLEHVGVVRGIVIVLKPQMAHELIGPIEVIRHRPGPRQQRGNDQDRAPLQRRSPQRLEARNHALGEK